MIDHSQLTIQQAHQLLKTKQLSSAELTQAVLEHIHRVESKIQALVTITDELAQEQAQKADKLIETLKRQNTLAWKVEE